MMKKSGLLLIVSLIIATSCKDEYTSNIPDSPVSLTCDLKNNFVQITTPGQFVKVSKIAEGYVIAYPDRPSLAVKTQKAQYARLGYAGLIVGNSSFNGYCAYDAACPVEASRKSVLTIINDGLGTAVCPTCGSKFNLNNGGIPIEGESKEQLKRYKVSLVSGGTELSVFD